MTYLLPKGVSRRVSLKSKLKVGQIFELSLTDTYYKIVDVWADYENGLPNRPVIMGKLHKLNKTTGGLSKSSKPITEELEYHYEGKPLIRGKIIK
jgi:hypothetical protein